MGVEKRAIALLHDELPKAEVPGSAVVEVVRVGVFVVEEANILQDTCCKKGRGGYRKKYFNKQNLSYGVKKRKQYNEANISQAGFGAAPHNKLIRGGVDIKLHTNQTERDGKGVAPSPRKKTAVQANKIPG